MHIYTIFAHDKDHILKLQTLALFLKRNFYNYEQWKNNYFLVFEILEHLPYIKISDHIINSPAHNSIPNIKAQNLHFNLFLSIFVHLAIILCGCITVCKWSFHNPECVFKGKLVGTVFGF